MLKNLRVIVVVEVGRQLLVGRSLMAREDSVLVNRVTVRFQWISRDADAIDVLCKAVELEARQQGQWMPDGRWSNQLTDHNNLKESWM